MTTYAVTNPATGEVEREFPTATDEQIAQALDAAGKALQGWSATAPSQRAQLLSRVADIYERRAEELAAIITREMGKPKQQAAAELQIVVSIYRYYAEHGEEYLADEEVPVARGGRALVRNEPYGVLLGIMPWNFPYYQVARFAAPNLMIGNTILLKHAPQCPESAAAMEEIFREAGLPEGAYVNVYASNEQVAEQIIPDRRVQGVSLTGSERAGAAVAEIAGKHLKKIVLELGGNDPFIVLDREVVPQAVKRALASRMGNAGQACNAAKRIIVLDEFYDEFVEKLEEAVRGVELGDPSSEDTFMGPMSSERAAEDLDAQVQDAVSHGAKVHSGGRRADRPGAWYEPTMLTGLTQEMRAYREELFGPVAMVYRVADDDAAVALANDSDYGLSASVHSSDVARAEQVAERLETGMVYLNEGSGTAAELPFGGVKRSGIGRELGRYGMEEFVNKRLVKYAKGS
ncbi:NAD-dependent succinate-semialdehyde dehydrogenase [Nesterenkonia aerolata]|uniref:NAD-dependent succinate-semialdehyde dehydrogenase n=1 Tax=Nesterenkonia aerolata TaxID=3074079 RepID=A0ABU2DUI0_9MICC|nr:NAD-dependent succinate-semialdehyde dehydrogenase [Nesterenkonia sp. LY-0111]MDR8020150.1 NAD-dependent succinate-semialdehyde dehydrogenase [Nesterenkonia sp. LY-0111]